jgi:hypothetical protein
LYVGSSFSLGGDTISVTSCGISALCTNGGPSDLQIVADPNAVANGAAFGVIIESQTNGANFLVGNGTGSGPFDDLTVGLSITGSLKIGAVGVNVTGTTVTAATAVNDGEFISGFGTTTVNAGSGITWIPLTPGQTSLSITKDLTANGDLSGNAGNKLVSVTQDFRRIPEPATAALLLAPPL